MRYPVLAVCRPCFEVPLDACGSAEVSDPGGGGGGGRDGEGVQTRRTARAVLPALGRWAQSRIPCPSCPGPGGAGGH